MAIVCACVTAYDTHDYRQQIERVQDFVKFLHIDFMDGQFVAKNSPSLEQAWWPEGTRADLHLMYQHPLDSINTLVRLRPHLVIVHAEAEGNFIEFARTLHKNRIKAGVALLPDTSVSAIASAIADIDYVLIFAGHLGYFGGQADLRQLDKVKQLKNLDSSIEIGWDGGVDNLNAKQIISAGVDVLNVGGFVQKSTDPRAAYAKIVNIAERQK